MPLVTREETSTPYFPLYLSFTDLDIETYLQMSPVDPMASLKHFQTRSGDTPGILKVFLETTWYHLTSIRLTLQIDKCLQVVTQAMEKILST